MGNWSWIEASLRSPDRARRCAGNLESSAMGTEKRTINDTSPAGLPRVLGAWIAIAIVVGTVIGSGVFLKPGSIAKSVPDFNYVALVWIGGGVLTLLGALALA